MFVENYGFYPPIFGPDGQAQPHPEARYLNPAQITEFAMALKAEMKEIGGTVFLNKCEHIFRRLDDHVGAQMKADHERAQALAVERGEKPGGGKKSAKTKGKEKAEAKAKAAAEATPDKSPTKAKTKTKSKAKKRAKAKAKTKSAKKS